MNYKLSTLEISPKTKASATSEIFVAEPDKNKEVLAGKLFAVIEIESTDIAALKTINFLTENITNNYYQDEKISLRETVKNIKIEHIFEAAIGKTNKNLINFLHNEKNKLNLGLINATIGVIYENNLCFVNAGKNKVKMIFKNLPASPLRRGFNETSKQGNNGAKEYSSVNIAGNANPAREQGANQGKLFTSVINGSIPVGGYIVFANEVLPEYISDKQMTEIITTLPPQGATEQIKNILSGVNNYVSFLGIIIKNTLGEKDLAPIIAPQKMTTEKSVSELNSLEEKTEKLLSTGGNINFKKITGTIKNMAYSPIFSETKKTYRENMGVLQNKDNFVAKRKINFLIFKKLLNLLQAIILYPIYILSALFKIIMYKDKRMEFFKNIKSKTSAKINGAKNWFLCLNKKNQTLFIVLVACALLFSANLSWLYLRNKDVAVESSYAEVTKKIEQKQNQVEANLLYNNEEGAKKILAEIGDLMRELPTDDAKNKDKYAELYNKHNIQLDKIRHAVKIDAKELINFSSINGMAQPENIIILDEKIYFGDSAQKTIYSFNLKTATSTAISTPQTTKLLSSPNTFKNNDIYYLNDKIAKLDTKTNKVSYLEMTENIKLENIVASAAFNNSFYLLDKNNGQVWRLNKTTNSLSTPATWLKNKAELSDAVDLDIDGNVYILKLDGSIAKYFKGESKDLNLEATDPIMEKASKIIVSENFDFMYVLDQTNNRVIVYTKTGDFIIQYHADQLSGLKDFAINETDKTIYFLNNASLYKANLEHIGIQE